jgi:4-amino-4-deoxy-L-arabinose transferase-like glycosyltransferase
LIRTPSYENRRIWASVLTFFIALIILVGVTIAWGPSKKFYPGGDSEQYMAIGQSLAEGNGFKDPIGPWPNLPDYGRMPAWPGIISIGIRIAPGFPPEAISRFSNVLCLSLAGTFFCSLCGSLGVVPWLSIVCGLGVSLSPSLVYFALDGTSEVCFVMILALGLMLLMAGPRWLYAAAFVFGFAALVRTNFILVPPLVLVLILLLGLARRELVRQSGLGRVILACAIAVLPTLVWAVRNAETTGRFPLLSTVEGETFYGANNEVVANNLDYWGYWVMPDTIPGEVPKLQLAHQLGTDLALNDYYHKKGVGWIKANLSAIPRLELGKFIRAFVPIPWKPLPVSYFVFSCRLVIYVLWLLLLPFWWPKISRTYLLFLLAMFITLSITTAVYYGTYRFTHCYVEILLIPCIVLGLGEWISRRNIVGDSAV